MASIQTSIQLTDKVSAPIHSMIRAMDNMCSAFERVDRGMDSAFSTEAIQNCRRSLATAQRQMDQLTRAARDSGDATRGLGSSFREAAGGADLLHGKIAGVVGAIGGMFAIRNVIGFIREATEAADVQLKAERQLAATMANTGGTQAGYEAITAHAADIQSRGQFGDEAMIGAAAEFSTYMQDTDAIQMMMDTLADYATGMSGGSAVGYEEMVNYATNLGKITTGAYDAMTKKGFEFTEAQKAVIKGSATQAQMVEALGADWQSMSEDMQKATVIAEVVGESWNGLYEELSNTPGGKLRQLKNTMGDLMEGAGNRLNGALGNFWGMLNRNLPTIQSGLNIITGALVGLINIATPVVDTLANGAKLIIDNWDLIAPVIGTVAAVLGAYNGVIFLTNAYHVASTAIMGGVQAAMTFLQIGYGVLTGNTAAASAAQFTYNSALLACPITWIVGLIIVLIGAIYLGTAAVNHFAGTSVSATGIIAGAFGVLFAQIYNTFVVPAWNAFAMIANFFANVFNNPVAAVNVLFYDWSIQVIGYVANVVHAIQDLINMIPGVNLAITEGIDNMYNSVKANRDAYIEKSGYNEVVKQKEFADLGSAAKSGYSIGSNFANTVSNKFKSLTGGGGGGKDVNIPELPAAIGEGLDNSGTGSAAKKAADSLSATEEDLKYMRDIAERDAINRFTTAEITINNTNTNHLSSGMDLDGMIDGMTAGLEDAIERASEGRHE